MRIAVAKGFASTSETISVQPETMIANEKAARRLSRPLLFMMFIQNYRVKKKTVTVKVMVLPAAWGNPSKGLAVNIACLA